MQVKRAFTLCVCLVLLLTMGGGILLSAFVVRANAATVQYSSALEDLEKDENFDAAQYPEIADDHSLCLIHLAESVNGEVFLYVYQPSKAKVATCVNMSVGERSVDYRFYTLSLLNSEGVFFKYKVNDLTVSEENTRQYDVVSILRAWEQGIDDGADPVTENTIDEVAFKVAKIYKYSDFPRPTLIVEDLEVISITDKFVGFMRYPDNGLFSKYDACDVHFIAFSTDKQIDQLLEADVYYESQSFSKTGIMGTCKYGTREKNKVLLSTSIDLNYDGNGWFSPTYNWKTIETASDFLASEEKGQMYNMGVFDVNTISIVDDTAKAEIASKEWVLRFALTEYQVISSDSQLNPHTDFHYTIVGDVSILRLAFKTNGILYNLGVVDNKQTGSTSPSNTTKTDIELTDSIEMILALLMLIVLFVFLWPVLSPLFSVMVNLVWFAIKAAFSAVLWMFGIPIRLIGRLFRG